MKTLDIARHEHCRLNQGFPNVIYMQELYSIDKKLEALEIIMKKKVNVDLLMTVEDVDIYNGFACNSGEYRKLTKEEFDLLKEVLK